MRLLDLYSSTDSKPVRVYYQMTHSHPLVSEHWSTAFIVIHVHYICSRMWDLSCLGWKYINSCTFISVNQSVFPDGEYHILNNMSLTSQSNENCVLFKCLCIIWLDDSIAPFQIFQLFSWVAYIQDVFTCYHSFVQRDYIHILAPGLRDIMIAKLVTYLDFLAPCHWSFYLTEQHVKFTFTSITTKAYCSSIKTTSGAGKET